MKRLSAAVLLIIISTGTCIFADTNVPSVISNTVNWSQKDSPYIIDGDVTVEKTGFVRIYPGTVVKFKKDARILVRGAMYSRGDPKNPVRMIPYDGMSFYNGIRFESNYKNIIEFTIIIRGQISCEASNITINNNYILNSTGIELFHFSEVLIKDNYFYNDTYGVYSEGKQLKFTVLQNTFNNGRYALYFKDMPAANMNIKNNNFFKNESNLTNYSVSDVQVKENYWGYTDEKGIDSLIFDKKDNEKAGKAVYQPYAKVPYELWQPTDAFISLVKIYLNQKTEEEPARVSFGFAANGIMPLNMPNVKTKDAFGIGLGGNFTANITGAFLFGLDMGSAWVAKQHGEDFEYSMNALNLLACGYGYMGYKKNMFFIPYLKIGLGGTILSEEYKYTDEHTKKKNTIGFTSQAGMGLEYFPIKFFSIRLESTINYLISPSGNMVYPLIGVSGNVYFDTPLFADEKGTNGPY